MEERVTMNILNSLQSLDQTLITGPSSLLYLTALLLGAWAIARGIWLLAKEGGDRNSRGGGWSGGIGHLVVGLFLVSEMNFLKAMEGTFFQNKNNLSAASILSYNVPSGASSGGGAAATMIQIGLNQLGTVGLFAVIYGLYQMKKAFDPGGDKKLIPAGLTHIIFGYVAADMQDVYPVIANTLGLPSS